MEQAERSSSARVLMTGNAALFIRVRALEASRAASSASIRMRSSSSGAHRWVLAVISSSGASWRIAASLSRRSPARGGGPRAAVMLIADRGPARRNQEMPGGDLPGAGHDDQQPPVIGAQLDSLADQPDGHGVAGRGEPHA